VTFLGWVVLLVPVAIVVYAGIRLVPVYLNYMRVAKSVDDTVSAFAGQAGASAQAIRISLGKRFDIDSITYPDVRDISIRRDGQSWVIEAKYTDGAPLFANVSLQIDFDKVAEFGG
jgi:Domain of unknown function (DUF4845)